MTFKEFLENNPKGVEDAKKCKSIDEFRKMVKNVGITYNSDKELEEAYRFVTGEMSDDALSAVSGGMRKHSANDVWRNNKGDVLTTGKGKSV